MSTIENIKARLATASPAPWQHSYAVDHADTTEPSTDKGAFLFMALNDDTSPLWLVENGEVIPAVTGDGPNAKANAEFIANAPTDIARLIAALEAVEALSYVKSPDPLIWGSDIRAVINEALEES